MAEYIEREAVMQKFADHVRRSNNSDFAPAPTWNQAVQIVEDFPAADVQPVVRASCGYPNPYTAQCTNCGTLYWDFRNLRDFKMNFCPNCGADMKEEQDGR